VNSILHFLLLSSHRQCGVVLHYRVVHELTHHKGFSFWHGVDRDWSENGAMRVSVELEHCFSSWSWSFWLWHLLFLDLTLLHYRVKLSKMWSVLPCVLWSRRSALGLRLVELIDVREQIPAVGTRFDLQLGDEFENVSESCLGFWSVERTYRSSELVLLPRFGVMGNLTNSWTYKFSSCCPSPVYSNVLRLSEFQVSSLRVLALFLAKWCELRFHSLLSRTRSSNVVHGQSNW